MIVNIQVEEFKYGLPFDIREKFRLIVLGIIVPNNIGMNQRISE